MSVRCGVCGRPVRVSKGLLIRHREPGGSWCDNARTSVETNARAEVAR